MGEGGAGGAYRTGVIAKAGHRLHAEHPLDDISGILPRDWQALLAEDDVELISIGMSGATVARLTDVSGQCRYLKLAYGSQAAGLARELCRTKWLASHGIRVPQPLMTIEEPGLTAAIVTALPGDHLGTQRRNTPAMIDSLARALSQLHSISTEGCPFDETVPVRLERARQAVEHDEIDAGEFDEANSHLSPKALYARVRRSVPGTEDRAVVHGDATLQNILIDDAYNVGFVDCGHAGVSDRYVDLALIEHELRQTLGDEAADHFIAAYGIVKWDTKRARFFLDLYEFF